MIRRGTRRSPVAGSLSGSVLVGLAVLIVGCGLVTTTPARHRPPLPPAEAMPALAVEDVVHRLTTIGYDCRFDPGGDIPSSWTCQLGDQDRDDFIGVGISSDEAGPIEHVSVYRHLGREDQPMDPAALDVAGAGAFLEVLPLIVPEEHRPTDDELLAGVQSNFPMELGDGWYLGFDRNSISRTMHVVYASDPP